MIAGLSAMVSSDDGGVDQILEISIIGHRLEDLTPARTASTPTCDEAIWLGADHSRQAQIVANLLDNAAKHTRPEARSR